MRAFKAKAGGSEKTRAGVSWANPEQIHLTIKFLGDIESDKIESVARQLEKAAEGIQPFTLSAAGVGGFPNERTPRVIWVGINGSGELAALQSRIDEGLAAIGFEKETRPFKPHLTLCRVRSVYDGRIIGEAVKDLEYDINMDFGADSFILFRSVLKPGGAEHTIVKRISLKQG